MTILLNYHIGRFVLGSLCVGDFVWLGCSGVRVASFSLQHGHHSNQAAPNLQHTQPATRTPLKPGRTKSPKHSACNTDRTQTRPHQISNTLSLQHGHYSNQAGAPNLPHTQPATRTPLKPDRTKSPTHSACNTDTTQTRPHQISNTQRTENKTTDVVIQQHSRKLLMMDILMFETC